MSDYPKHDGRFHYDGHVELVHLSQEVLDAIGDAEAELPEASAGSLLVATSEGWTTLAPGCVGQVLAMGVTGPGWFGLADLLAPGWLDWSGRWSQQDNWIGWRRARGR